MRPGQEIALALVARHGQGRCITQGVLLVVHVQTANRQIVRPCHGLGGDDSAARGSVSDPQIENALHYLAKRIGKPGSDKKPQQEDLYFLWSLERVGVLYGLRAIEGKDWYAWGANLLQAHQSKEGNWQNGRYHGSSPTLDTCFALLFLERANLVHDLTKKIEFLKIELRSQE